MRVDYQHAALLSRFAMHRLCIALYYAFLSARTGLLLGSLYIRVCAFILADSLAPEFPFGAIN